jgi:hypothetical protein
MGTAAKATCSSALVAGIVYGVFFVSGVSIDPQDLVVMVFQAIIGQLAPRYDSVVGVGVVVLTLIGIWQTITLVASGIQFGIAGMAMTLFAFFGATAIFFQPTQVYGALMMIASLLLAAAL